MIETSRIRFRATCSMRCRGMAPPADSDIVRPSSNDGARPHETWLLPAERGARFPPETPELARVTMHVARGAQTKQLLVAWSGDRDVSAADSRLACPAAPKRRCGWTRRRSPGRCGSSSESGTPQAKVTLGEPTFQNSDATLPIAIDEGVLSRLSTCRSRASIQRDNGRAGCAGTVDGEPFAASAPVDAARRLKGFYLDWLSECGRRARGDDGKRWIGVDRLGRQGRSALVVKDVNVLGAETTNAGLVQNAVTVEPGAVMSQGALDTTRRNLYDIGRFAASISIFETDESRSSGRTATDADDPD